MIKYEDKYQEKSACLHGIHDAHIVYCLRAEQSDQDQILREIAERIAASGDILDKHRKA